MRTRHFIAASTLLHVLALAACGGGGAGTGSTGGTPPGGGPSNPPPPQQFDIEIDYLVYIANDNVGDPSQARHELYSYQPETGAHHKLSPDFVNAGKVYSFAIAPDRSKVVFTSDHEIAGVIELYSVNPDGSGLVKLNQPVSPGGGVNPFGIRWSPDGAFVAYHADLSGDGNNELYTVTPTGSAHFRVSLTGGGDPVTETVEWSPNGDFLLFRHSGGGSTLYVARPDGTGLTGLSNSPYLGGAVFENNVQWAPDGSRILFFADDDVADTFELYSVRPDGSGRMKLNGPLVPGGDVFGSSVHWSPDSTKVVYAANAETVEVVEVYSVDADGTNRIKLNDPFSVPPTATPASEGVIPFTVKMAPDGSRITYLVTPTVRELYSAKLDGSANVKLNGPFATMFSHVDDKSVRWSPDGERVLYVANETVNAIDDLYSVSPDGLDRAVLTAPASQARTVVGRSVQWAPNGSSVVYLSNQTNSAAFDLYGVLPDGTELVTLNDPLPAGMHINEERLLYSPNGAAIIYLIDDADGTKQVVAVSADGTTRATLNGPLGADAYIVTDEVRWSPDGSWVAYRADQDADDVFELFVSRPDGSSNVKVHPDLATGQRIESTHAWAP